MKRLFDIIKNFFTYEVEVPVKEEELEDDNLTSVYNVICITGLIGQPSRHFNFCSVKSVTKDIAPHLPEVGEVGLLEFSNKTEEGIIDRTIEDLEDMKLPVVDINRGVRTTIISFIPYIDDSIEVDYIT